MRRKLFILTALALSTAPSAFADITGTLINSQGRPLPGCEVGLGQTVVLSDSNGSFRIQSVTGIAPPASEPAWKFRNGTLSLDLSAPREFGFEIFDLRGNRLAGFAPRLLPPGHHSIEPFRRAGRNEGPAPYVIRLSSGASGPSLPARAKAAAASDSLRIKCGGFAPLAVSVASNGGNLGNILVSIPDGIPQGMHVEYNPYAQQAGGWYKVITHSHTVAHGGNPTKTTPDKMAQAYKDLGMHAVAFTDHDVYTKPAAVPGILYIPGEEVTTSDGDMNVFGINKAVAAGMNGQKVVDAAIANGNGFTQVNHPLDSDANDDGRLLSYLSGLKNLWGIEIYNGGRLSQDATAAWDHLISQRKRVWATAGDDAHSKEIIDDGTGIPETGRMWIVVNSAEPTAEGILAGMRSGRFYASEGPDMTIGVQGDTVIVNSAAGNTVSWYKAGRTLIKKTTLGGTADRYVLTGPEVFVRVLVTDKKGKRAASQPIFTK